MVMQWAPLNMLKYYIDGIILHSDICMNIESIRKNCFPFDSQMSGLVLAALLNKANII